MRVLLNMLVASGKKTGIGHYAGELLRCLREQAEDDAIESFPRSWLRWTWSKCHQLRPYLDYRKSTATNSTTSQQPSALMASLRSLGQRVITGHFERVCRARQYDIYHEPNYLPLPSTLPTIATICDLSLLLHPLWHPADRVANFEKHLPRTLKQCVHFLAISDFTRREIIRTLSLPPERVTRTYMGVRQGLMELPAEQVATALRRLNFPERYLLYLGTLEPRKNVLMLMQVYCSLPEQFRRRWPLLLVGNWGWNTAALRNYFHNDARHRGVIHLGYVADKHLNVLYNGARALLFPSYYEGFGLPPVEMMACGGAVLASTAGAVAEVTGGQAHLVDPNNRDAWRAALQRVAEDDDWQQSLRDGAAATVRHFTWQQCAAETLQVYRHVCQTPSTGDNKLAA